MHPKLLRAAKLVFTSAAALTAAALVLLSASVGYVLWSIDDMNRQVLHQTAYDGAVTSAIVEQAVRTDVSIVGRDIFRVTAGRGQPSSWPPCQMTAREIIADLRGSHNCTAALVHRETRWNWMGPHRVTVVTVRPSAYSDPVVRRAIEEVLLDDEGSVAPFKTTHRRA